MDWFYKKFKDFRQSQSGAIAVIFALWIVPSIIVAGMAVDIGRLIYVNSRLSTAVDAAAIAGARYDSASAITNAKNVFAANFPAGFMGLSITPTVTVASDQSTVTVTASGNLPTILATYISINTLKTSATATVGRTLLGLEIAMVLDISGSMYEDPSTPGIPASSYANSKIYGLKVAATNFLNAIYGTANTRANTSVSLIPFIMTVNVGSANTALLSDPIVAVNPLNFPLGSPWSGCVKVRTPFANEFTETPPSTQKWPTYFTPSTYTSHLPNVQWDNDYTILSNAIKVINPPIYGGVNYSAYVNIGPNRGCSSPMVTVINDKSVLTNAINNLYPLYTGGTDQSLGLAWGWRTISPLWSGVWNSATILPYSAPNNLKAVILMTDGAAQWGDSSNPPLYEATSYNTAANPAGGNRLTASGFATSATNAITNIQNNVTLLCNGMKAQGIEIYTVLFQVNDPATQAIFSGCATDSAHYFLATSSADLNTHFQTIANNLQRVTVIQ